MARALRVLSGAVRTLLATSGGDGYGFLVGDDGRLHQAGFGPAMAAHVDNLAPGLPPAVYPLAYPAYDEEPTRAPALRVTHADGTTTTRLRVDAVEAPPSPSTAGAVGIRLVDTARPLAVTLQFRAEAHGVQRQWVEVTNHQDGPITLHEVAAAAPVLPAADAHLTHFGGDWAAEWTATTERLTLGTKVLESRGGVRPHLLRNPFFLLAADGPVTETAGEVVAGSLAWGGNVRFAFERPAHPIVRAWCGHNPFAADYVLDPGVTFATPEMVWAWSTTGTGPLSRRLHRWVRESVVRDGLTLRSIVVNNWEATGFAFDERRLLDLVDDTAELGAELFLLDDGWFGDGHPRDDDTAGLGDWTVDRRKLPNGLEPVIDRARSRGVDFGLWIEPEMVNPRSDLYRRHPDWVVAQPDRERREERQQLVLDVLQPEVAEFVTATVDRLLAEHPGITYLKWDANRMLTEPGSPALARDRQSNYWVDQARATWQLMDAVAARHPAVRLMLCASGGGRVDVGTLRRFHEVWLSDNTDPVDRVRMQWAASHLLPANVVGAHVTRWGERPVAFGCAVAMSARFGFDIDTAGLSEEERSVCRRAVETYRQVRDLVQLGDLYRLVPPLAADPCGERAALLYAGPDADRAVVFAYQLTARPDDGDKPPALRLAGLAPGATYEVRPIDLADDQPVAPTEARGDALSSEGLDWPLHEATTARIWTLTHTPE